MPDAAFGNLPFDEAIKYFQDKGIAISPESWKDIWQQANKRSFTVARVTAMDVLEDIRGEVDKAVSEGVSLGQFKKDLRETLERKGWYAPKGEESEIEMPDGTVRKRLAPWRLRTIYQNNLQTAYSVGRHNQMMESVTRPFWQYMAIRDIGTRPDHGAQHGKVFHRDHPFWDQWYPPNGFNCRCYVKTLNSRQMEQRELEEQRRGVKEMPDDGWRYNPAKEGLASWKPDLKKYPPEARQQLEVLWD
jgi:SPP1 gp7 family putative phage head morphogenesis protein